MDTKGIFRQLAPSAVGVGDTTTERSLSSSFAPVHYAPRRRDADLPHRLALLAVVCDALVILYALFSAYWLRFHSGLEFYGTPLNASASAPYPQLIVGATIALLVSLYRSHVYEKQSLLRYRYVSMQVARACIVWTAGCILVTMLVDFNPQVSRLFGCLGALLASLALLLWRAVFHRLLRNSAVAASLRQRILCVGWNEDAARFSHCFDHEESPAYEVVGCVCPPSGRLAEPPPSSVAVLGGTEDIERLLHEHQADIVMLTDVDCVKSEIVSLVNLCEKELVQFTMIPSYFQILSSGLHLQTVNGIPVLGVTRLPLDRWFNTTLKRTVDIVGALVGLVLSAPLVAVCAALVYRESPGPVFYRQTRLGPRGNFGMYKIRSMRLDAEKGGAAGWSVKDDPRRLKIGGFLRRYNLDELPQFWNVLKGQMSLVGPRPERPEIIYRFKEEVPHYNARHNAKPGLTGWAQVNGFRGDTDLNERIRCDLFYLENWNLLLDCQIMVMTLMSNKNAR